MTGDGREEGWRGEGRKWKSVGWREKNVKERTSQWERREEGEKGWMDKGKNVTI